MIRAADPAPILATRHTIDAHVAAELTSDAPTIVATVSGDPFFPALVRDATGRPQLELLTTTSAVADFYRARLGTFEIVDTTRVAELRSDWYALHESVATVRHVGDYHGVEPTGALHRVHSVVLFPVEPGAIVGELEWTHVDFVKVFGSAPPTRPDLSTFVPEGRLAAAELHDRLLERWFAGDGAGLDDLLGPIPWASRHVHASGDVPEVCAAPSGAGVADAGSAFARLGLAGAPVRLQRLAADWYSFVEAAADVDTAGGRRTIRVASLLALDEGRPAGHLAYSVDADR